MDGVWLLQGKSINRSLIDLPTLRLVPVEYLYWTNDTTVTMKETFSVTKSPKVRIHKTIKVLHFVWEMSFRCSFIYSVCHGFLMSGSIETTDRWWIKNLVEWMEVNLLVRIYKSLYNRTKIPGSCWLVARYRTSNRMTDWIWWPLVMCRLNEWMMLKWMVQTGYKYAHIS